MKPIILWGSIAIAIALLISKSQLDKIQPLPADPITYEACDQSWDDGYGIWINFIGTCGIHTVTFTGTSTEEYHKLYNQNKILIQAEKKWETQAKQDRQAQIIKAHAIVEEWCNLNWNTMTFDEFANCKDPESTSVDTYQHQTNGGYFY